jgi:hypothetical protein
VADLHKPTATLGGAPLAGTSSVTWSFRTGTAPFVTTMTAHQSVWDDRLKSLMGLPVTLAITDSRGVKVEVKKLTILHVVPSVTPHTVSFLVADLRWKWPYTLIARDYNTPKKTGDRTALNTVPVEATVTVDQYAYRRSSLNQGQRWTAKDAVIDVLELLEPVEAGPGTSFRIDSWPVKEDPGTQDGQFSIQGVTLRDSGDVALARLMSLIPGAELWVDKDGVVRVFDGADIRAADEFLKTLPPATWGGEKPVKIDRSKIRPNIVVVHYQREVEMLVEFEDDYSQNTRAPAGRNTPFLENVIPTVDPETAFSAYDPETDTTTTKTVPAGTWVPVEKWLAAMEADREQGHKWPWSFETIRRFWVQGDLEGALGARPDQDDDPNGNRSLRVQALKEHFRQTFRLSRRYMERIKGLAPVRAAMLDPVTGARAPAAVWGQACVFPSTKGARISHRIDIAKSGMATNIDMLAASQNGANIVTTAPGPTSLEVVDQDLGILAIHWRASPYGTDGSIVPCNMVNQAGANKVPVRDLGQQDTEPMGVGISIYGGTNGSYLKETMEMKALLTMVPAAPNNVRQFHRERVHVSDIKELFRTEFAIEGGRGPELRVFVPPTEVTARFAWTEDGQARQTLERLLGLDTENLDEAGIDEAELPGFTFSNGEKEVRQHALALAAELLAVYCDSTMGRVATRVPDDGGRLVGNMASVTISVAAAPSGKVVAVHDFPGQQRPLSRMALLPDSARQLILGTLSAGIKQ